MTTPVFVVLTPSRNTNNNETNMNSIEAARMVALIKAINGNKEAVAAIDDPGLRPWWRTRLAGGTAGFWIPVLEAFAKDGAVEIEQSHVAGLWRVCHVADFNHDLACYRPVSKPLCVWAVVRDRSIVCVNFSEDVAKLAAHPDDTVVKLVEEVEK